jgi:uncharacterized protein (TIGR00730 family)
LKKNICIFGGSKSGRNINYENSAKIIGKLIAENGYNMIFGAGETGIMGASASSAIKYGAKTTGIIPNFLFKKDILDTKHSKEFNSKVIMTEDMHQRKKLMYNKSDAFLILPGGVGTLDECFEVLTWCQLKQISNKKVGIINFDKYWDPLLKLINHLIKEEFMGEYNLNFFKEIKNINNLKKFLKNI